MRNLVVWILLISFAATLCQAADRAQEFSRRREVPDWYRATAIDLANLSKTSLEARSDVVEYLLFDRQVRVAEQTRLTHTVYRILSDAGLANNSTIIIEFDPEYEQPCLHALRIWRNGEARDLFDSVEINLIQQEKDLDRNLYNGQKSAVILLKDVRVGDIIESLVSSKGYNPVFKGVFSDRVFAGWSVPVRTQKVSFVVPSGRVLQFKNLGLTPLTFSASPVDGGLEYRWEGSDLPAARPEQEAPSWYPMVATVDLSEYDSWSQVAEWACPLYGPDASSDTVVAQTVERFRKPEQRPEELAVLLLDFVQREIRYLGIEMGAKSHAPSSPALVLERRHGDCKDKVRLLCALLTKAGIDSYPVLVNTYRRERVGEQQPSPLAFNHVIACLRIEGLLYFVDPTNAYQRGSLEHHSLGYPTAGLLVVKNSPGIFPIHPSGLTLPRTKVREYYKVTDYQAPVDLEVVYSYTGALADNLRGFLKHTPPVEVQKGWVNFYKLAYPELLATKDISWTDEEEKNRVEVKASFQIPRLWLLRKGSTDFLDASFWPIVLKRHVSQPETIERVSPLALDFPSEVDYRAEIEMPSDWTMNANKRTVETKHFAFVDGYVGKGNKVFAEMRWAAKADHVQREDLPEHVQKLAEVRNGSGVTLTHNLKVSARLKRAGFNYRTSLALLLGMAGAIALFRFWLYPRRKPGEVSQPPLVGKPLGGWLLLPALGLVSSPLVLGTQLISQWEVLFLETTWIGMTDPTSSLYIEGWGLSFLFETLLNGFGLVFVFLVLWLFFKRKAEARRAMVFHYCFFAGAGLFGVYQALTLLSPESREYKEAMSACSRACLGVCIWVPYFLRSRRVKETFVR